MPVTWRERLAFEIRDHRFRICDVVLAAAIRGDLEPALDETRRRLQQEALAAAEGREADIEAVEALMDEFRYAHGLVTVEETEQWLDQFGLTTDDLSDHFVRRHWRSPVGMLPERVKIPDEAVAGAWAPDLVLTGGFHTFARRFAREQVARLLAPKAAGSDPALVETFRLARGFEADAFETWCRNLELDPAMRDDVLAGQQAMERVRQDLRAPARQAEGLLEIRSRMVRMDLLVAEFDSETAAQEAYLCVTADGMSLEAVAAESGSPLSTRSAAVGEYPESWHPHLAGALPGRTLHPPSEGGRHCVCRVVDEEEPVLSDPAVAEAVEALLMNRHLGRLEKREVRWHVPMGDIA